MSEATSDYKTNKNPLPVIDYEKYLTGTKAQVEINRYKNAHKDPDKPIELWGLILGRPFGNLLAAIESHNYDSIETYAYQVSAVLTEVLAYAREANNCLIVENKK